MPKVRHLSKAPILEAVIDFRVTLPKDFDASRFGDLPKVVGTRYPVAEAMQQIETSFTFPVGRQGTAQASSAGRPVGFTFRSRDGLDVAQFGLNGYTYSRLQPYTSWNEMYPEAVRLWREYAKAARPETCSRIGVRYINKIDIPVGGGELSDYLTAPPGVPDGVPDQLAGFLTKVIIQEKDTGISATITQASQVQLDPQSAAIILDIEAHRASDAGVLQDEFEDVLDKLHDMKNRLFFGSLTDDLIKRYE